MELRVEAAAGRHRLVGAGGDVELVNQFLEHLSVRNFAAATRRASAFDLLSFLRFCNETGLSLDSVVPTDVFDYLGWRPASATGQVVVPLRAQETAPATTNRRVAALRALFEYLVICGIRSLNPLAVGSERGNGAGVYSGTSAGRVSRPVAGW